MTAAIQWRPKSLATRDGMSTSQAVTSGSLVSAVGTIATLGIRQRESGISELLTLAEQRPGVLSQFVRRAKTQPNRRRTRIRATTPTGWFEQVRLSIEAAFADSTMPNWDGYGAPPASEASKDYALEFVRRLPSYLPVPSAAVDRDGDISLEWYQDPEYVFSVSIGANGNLIFAGIFGPRTLHGSEPLADGSLATIINGITRLTRD